MMEVERWIAAIMAEVESREEMVQWELEEDEAEWRWEAHLEGGEDE